MPDDIDTHAICYQTVDRLRADYSAALAAERDKLAADYLIAQRIRWMCMPGQKRKTVRIEELRDLLDAADGRAETT